MVCSAYSFLHVAKLYCMQVVILLLVVLVMTLWGAPSAWLVSEACGHTHQCSMADSSPCSHMHPWILKGSLSFVWRRRAGNPEAWQRDAATCSPSRRTWLHMQLEMFPFKRMPASLSTEYAQSGHSTKWLYGTRWSQPKGCILCDLCKKLHSGTISF